MKEKLPALYVFLDEGGNLDFSNTGTKYFVITALSKERPFEAYKHLNDLKYDLVERGVEIEYFHASENKQDVRDSVFAVIDAHLDQTRIDCLVIDKSKVREDLQGEEKFYPEMLGHLLEVVVRNYDLKAFSQVIVFTDTIPVQRKRRSIEKTIKRSLGSRLPAALKYRICHHNSKSNYDLQIVDYCNWAVYRKQGGDKRSYEIIKRVVRTETTL